MKATEIEVGKTYMNRGAGRTRRTVLGIGLEHRPTDALSRAADADPNALGVLYAQVDKSGATIQRTLYLDSFAAWAGKEAA